MAQNLFMLDIEKIFIVRLAVLYNFSFLEMEKGGGKSIDTISYSTSLEFIHLA